MKDENDNDGLPVLDLDDRSEISDNFKKEIKPVSNSKIAGQGGGDQGPGSNRFPDFKPQRMEFRRSGRRFPFKQLIVALVFMMLGMAGYLLIFKGPIYYKVYYFLSDQVEFLAREIDPDLSISENKVRQRSLGGVDQDSSPISPGSIEALDMDWEEMDCKFLVQEALSRKHKKNLDEVGEVWLAECYLFMGEIARAYRLLKKNQNILTGKRLEWTPERIDNFLTFIEASIYHWRLDTAENLTHLLCRGWQWSPGCIAKLMVAAASGNSRIAETGFLKLSALKNKFGQRAYTYILIAGGRAALASKNYKKAMIRYGQALNSARDNRYLSLRSEEGQMITAYASKDQVVATRIFRSVKSKYRKKNRELLGKFGLLYGLSSKKASGSTMKKFLRKGYINAHTKRDPFFLEIVVLEAIKNRLPREINQYLNGVRLYLKKINRKNKEGLREVELMIIRSRIAQDQNNFAFKKLVGFQKRYGVDARSLHLKAVLIMTIFNSQKYYSLAAKNFQSAVMKQDNWQSFFGLGWSLILSKQYSKVPSIIDAWKARKFDNDAGLWLSLLHAKYFISVDKLDSANQALLEIGQNQHLPPIYWTLKSEILSAKKQGVGARKIAEQMKDNGTFGRNWSVGDVESNPLGPMARLNMY